MEELYPKRPASVNGRRHDLPDPDTLLDHLRLHPALARRKKDVSKGAREVFAWIMALALVHRRDDPTTPWLAEATGDSERQVARSLAELEDLGTLRVLGDGHNRRLRIAAHMAPAKDSAGNPDESVTDGAGYPDESVKVPGNNLDTDVRVPSRNPDKNGRDSRGRVGVPESKKEFRSPDSETPSLASSQLLSEEGRKKARGTWALFNQHPKNGSVREYEGLLLRYVGREECFDLAVLQAVAAQDGETLKVPVAFIRHVLTTHLQDDKDTVLALLEQAQHDYETPAQRREIDARERRAAADKAAHAAPPAAPVTEMLAGLGGTSSGRQAPPPPRDTPEAPLVPMDADVRARLSVLGCMDQDRVRHLAEAFAQQEDAATIRLSHAHADRKNLIRRHLRAALGQWEQEQACKPKLKSPKELCAAIRSGKMVRSEAVSGDQKETT